jgi:hypothetical protein
VIRLDTGEETPAQAITNLVARRGGTADQLQVAHLLTARGYGLAEIWAAFAYLERERRIFLSAGGRVTLVPDTTAPPALELRSNDPDFGQRSLL